MLPFSPHQNIVRYRAEAFYMDTETLAKGFGRFLTLEEAKGLCQRHAMGLLRFQARTPGIWKAQGEHCWYRITRSHV